MKNAKEINLPQLFIKSVNHPFRNVSRHYSKTTIFTFEVSQKHHSDHSSYKQYPHLSQP